MEDDGRGNIDTLDAGKQPVAASPNPQADARASLRNRPIGIFDSGVGGLTVARSIVDQLPNESIIYVGDTKNSPYGPKSQEEVANFSRAIADDLVAQGCKMIVIACNTATSAFLEEAQQRYDVPVIGVIEPAVKRAKAVTRNHKIGVIGTEGTVNSKEYQHQIEAGDSLDQCFAAACPRFVDFVERGITSGRQILGVTSAYVEPLQMAGVDTLVLGCTHYPLLTGVIQLVMGDDVTLVSSSEETAKAVVKHLNNADMLADEPDEGETFGGGKVTRTFVSTGDPDLFRHLASRFLGPAVTQVSQLGRV